MVPHLIVIDIISCKKKTTPSRVVILHTNNLHGCYLVIPAVYLVLPLTVEAVKS